MKPWILVPSLSILAAVPVARWASERAPRNTGDTAGPEASRTLASLEQRVQGSKQKSAALAREAALRATPAPGPGDAQVAPSDEEIEAAVARWISANAAGNSLATSPAADPAEDMASFVQRHMGQGFIDMGSETMFEELRQAGRLDEFVAWVEDMAENDPENAELQVALGVGYLQRLFELGATPEAGALAMKADSAFDAALAIDPENHDARFTKAVSLSNWPPFLGKTGEAIANFEILIAQQKERAPEPGYAQSYLFLGNMYIQTGEKEKALAAWRDGLVRYPQDEDLLAQVRTHE